MKAKKIVVLALTAAVLSSSLSGCGLSDLNLLFNSTKQSPSGGGQGGNSLGGSTATTGSGEFDINSDETKKKVSEVESIINNYYYFETDSNLQEESYFDGIMKGLDDPYSVYYTQEEFQKLMEDDGGEYQGIGAVVSKNMETNQIYVVKPIVGGPAERVGILPNDVFVAIDDETITGDMELDEVVDKIRGAEGSTVHLQMYREGESDYLYFDVTREVVQNITVESEMLENGLGYISVEQFIENTPEQFENQLDQLIADGAKGIIVDLRNNPGGLLTAVVEMCDYIVPDGGVIVSTKDKNGKEMEVWNAEDGHSVDIPMAVLINGNSASASEIFTGCMKDYGIAKIVGTTSYGKGIVQSVIPLSDGSAVKVTIAKYFTPSGNDIHKLGIDPDIEVELTDEQKRMVTVPHEEDGQLQEAIKALQ